MQLIVNTESTDTDKMSTIEQESLIEKPFVNRSEELNDVIKAIEGHEIPIANKENIQIEENKIINTDQNRNPERTQEVRAEDKIIVHIKEDAKIYTDGDAATANEHYEQLSDGTEPDCPVIENETGNATHEIDRNNSSVEENKDSQNVDVKYDTSNDAENEIVGGDKNDDDGIVTEIKSVKETQSLEETNNDILKENNIIDKNDDDGTVKDIKLVKETQSLNETNSGILKENNIDDEKNSDLKQLKKVKVCEVKEINNKFMKTLQVNSHEGTVPLQDSIDADESETIAHEVTNMSSGLLLGSGEGLNNRGTVSQEIAQTSTVSEDGVHRNVESEGMIIFSGDNSDFKEKGDNASTEILDHGDVTEVFTEEKNNSAQFTDDVEMVSTERNINNIADINIEENKCVQIVEAVEVVSLEDENRNDADIQGIIKMDVSENLDKTTNECLKDVSENVDKTTIESSMNNKIDVEDEKKDDSFRQVITTSNNNQNENKQTSTSHNNTKMDIVEDKNNSENHNETKRNNVSTVNEIVDLDEVNIVEDDRKKELNDKNEISSVAQKVEEKKICTTTIRLSNTLDILSDDDEDPVKATSPEPSKVDIKKVKNPEASEKCISLDDDDDIMLIDDVTSSSDKQKSPKVDSGKLDLDAELVDSNEVAGSMVPVTSSDLDPVIPQIPTSPKAIKEQIVDESPEKIEKLIPDNFFKSFKKNIAEMTRDDLEEFCTLKLVESIIERSNLNDIKSKLKTMAIGIEEYKKKAMMLSKQNRDLQVVLKSIQEELKKKSGNAITPLKITRSVGMQVIMPDKNRRKGTGQNTGVSPNTNAQTNVINNNTIRPQKNSNQNQRLQKPATTLQTIPVPRLVPATNTNVTNKPAQTTTTTTTTTNNAKATASLPNGTKNSPPTQKTAEKRTHNRAQSVTVDLTDDEPPAKQTPKNSPVPPVRLIPSQNLLSARQQFTQNSPRKVYIPISGPQSQNIRPAQTVMLKNVSSSTPRPTRPPMVRLPQSSVRSSRAANNNRHPAPLPDAMKQYQPPNWKALPPAPDLKLSKVENGIVISWKIDGYQEDSYEEIASFQLYAYQETSTPPNTGLWKKIGDVKALPLPMACTLTQFMAGYKYYFAVRAVDIRSRVGPFSLPGSILLLNKM